jgi:hypothetical protein
VYNRASPKAFKGVTLTGPLLVQLLSAAVEAANKPGGVLTVGSVWGAMVESELKAALEAAHESYKKAAKALASCTTAEQAQSLHAVRGASC